MGFTLTAVKYLIGYRIWFLYAPLGIMCLITVTLMVSLVKWLRQAAKSRDGLRVHGQSAGNSSSYTRYVVPCVFFSTKMVGCAPYVHVFTINSVCYSALLVIKLMVLMGTFFVLDFTMCIMEYSGVSTSIYSILFCMTYLILREGCLFWIFVWSNDIREQVRSKLRA